MKESEPSARIPHLAAWAGFTAFASTAASFEVYALRSDVAMGVLIGIYLVPTIVATTTVAVVEWQEMIEPTAQPPQLDT